MKRFTLITTAVMAASLSFTSVPAYAEEAAETPYRQEQEIPEEKPAFGKRKELTDEEKAALIEKRKAALEEKLAAGEISQEQYEKAIERMESGVKPFRPSFDGESKQKMKDRMAEMTEEEKAGDQHGGKNYFHQDAKVNFLAFQDRHPDKSRVSENK